jgi:hypothetical protein
MEDFVPLVVKSILEIPALFCGHAIAFVATIPIIDVCKRRSVERETKTGETKMFYAANSTGKKFVAKRVWADGDVTLSGKLTFDAAEAFVFETVEAANAAAVNLFRKDAGEAIAVASKPVPKSTTTLSGFRPSRHQIEEASIHGDHELYT